MPNASVKIMLSYDYNHFEIALGIDENLTLKEINELRKDVQRLADKAVNQYKIAKEKASKRINIVSERKKLEREIEILFEQKPKSEWTAEEMAKIKALDDKKYWDQHLYYYEDVDNEF